MRNYLILLTIAALLGACSSWTNSSQPSVALQGGVGGAVLGAGTGAAVGSLISGGEVGPSALVGAGVGLAVGTAGALVYQHQVREEVIQDNNSKIRSLESELDTTKREIESLRQSITEQSDPVQEVQRSDHFPYQGVTVGKSL